MSVTRVGSEVPGIRHEYVRANGLRFHVATCGEGDRLALCLHGFPESHYSWRHQMPLLASLGYRVWAPDLRGYGETERPSEMKDYAIELLLEDVAGLIDASGASSVVLIAHDWGAIIAWSFAMRNPERLARLVILNVPHPAMMAPGLRRPRQLLKSWYALFFQIPRLPEKLLGRRGAEAVGRMFWQTAVHKEQFGPEVQQAYSQNAAIPGALKAMIDYYRAYGRGGGGRRVSAFGYPRIDVPTLMLWGIQDLALTVELSHGVERHLSDLTLRYLPDASHWVQQDQPEVVNQMLAAWLRGEQVAYVDR